MSVTLQLERLAVDLVQEGAPKLRRAAGLVDDGLCKRVLAGNVELVSCKELFKELQVGDAVGFGQVDARFCKDQIPNPIHIHPQLGHVLLEFVGDEVIHVTHVVAFMLDGKR